MVPFYSLLILVSGLVLSEISIFTYFFGERFAKMACCPHLVCISQYFYILEHGQFLRNGINKFGNSVPEELKEITKSAHL
jgi:hypothetical protein